MDRSKQTMRTHRDIENAVLSLMDRMPFEKITVNDIVKEALINRSTFYQHFQDKYAVMETLEADYIKRLSDVFTQLREKDAGMDFMDRLLKEYFERNRDILRRLMKMEDFERQIRSLVKDYLLQIMPGIPDSESEMFTSMTVSFLLYVMEHPKAEEKFSTRFFEHYLDMTVRFFRLDRIPDGKQKLMNLIGEANAGH